MEARTRQDESKRYGAALSTSVRAVTLTLPLLLALAGCAGGGDAPPPPGDAAGAPTGSEGARTLPIPGGAVPPPGHPDTGGTAASHDVTWKVPAGWAEEAPANRMRVAQYRVPGDDGEAECVVFYFGPGMGGDAMANARRWAGQFTQPDGRPALDAMQLSRLDGAQLPVQLVEVRGTYDGGMSGSGPLESAMLLGGIADGPDAPWFFKLTGPEGTVEAQRDAFVELLESVRVE